MRNFNIFFYFLVAQKRKNGRKAKNKEKIFMLQTNSAFFATGFKKTGRMAKKRKIFMLRKNSPFFIFGLLKMALGMKNIRKKHLLTHKNFVYFLEF